MPYNHRLTRPQDEEVSVIDWDRIEVLQQEVGADAFDEIVIVFLDEVDTVIDRLAATPDPGNLHADLHFLKGSGLNLGFAEFAELCRQGEDRAAAGGAVDVAAIVASYRASRAALLAHIAEPR